MEKVKIVLDADVIIHFTKGSCLSMLPAIFPDYDFVVLGTVYEEIKTIRQQLDNQISRLKNISVVPFEPTGEMMREFARLTECFGKGESACMAYCRYTNNVIGSSNLKDIKQYCSKNGIVYLTTLDFLYYAYIKHLMTLQECNDFISTVRSKGSQLPDIEIDRYACEVMM